MGKKLNTLRKEVAALNREVKELKALLAGGGKSEKKTEKKSKKKAEKKAAKKSEKKAAKKAAKKGASKSKSKSAKPSKTPALLQQGFPEESTAAGGDEAGMAMETPGGGSI